MMGVHDVIMVCGYVTCEMIYGLRRHDHGERDVCIGIDDTVIR